MYTRNLPENYWYPAKRHVHLLPLLPPFSRYFHRFSPLPWTKSGMKRQFSPASSFSKDQFPSHYTSNIPPHPKWYLLQSVNTKVEKAWHPVFVFSLNHSHPLNIGIAPADFHRQPPYSTNLYSGMPYKHAVTVQPDCSVVY